MAISDRALCRRIAFATVTVLEIPPVFFATVASSRVEEFGGRGREREREPLERGAEEERATGE